MIDSIEATSSVIKAQNQLIDTLLKQLRELQDVIISLRAFQSEALDVDLDTQQMKLALGQIRGLVGAHDKKGYQSIVDAVNNRISTIITLREKATKLDEYSDIIYEIGGVLVHKDPNLGSIAFEDIPKYIEDKLPERI